MSLKSTIKKYRKEDESLKTTAKRLAQNADGVGGTGHEAAKKWLANKAWKPARKNVPTRTAEPVAVVTSSKPRKK